MCLWKEVVWPLLEGHKRTSYGLLATSFRRGDENCSPNVHGFFLRKNTFWNKNNFHFRSGFDQQFFHFWRRAKSCLAEFLERIFKGPKKNFARKHVFFGKNKHFFLSGFHTLSNKYKTLAKVSRPVCHIAVWVSSGVFRREWFLEHF